MSCCLSPRYKSSRPLILKPPPPREEDLELHNHSGDLEVMLLSLLRSFGKYHYQGSNPCGGVAQAQA